MDAFLKFRRFWIGALAFLLTTACLIPVVPGVSAESLWEVPVLASEAAILMDADTGQILFEKNMDARMYPASITKVLTGYLALKYAGLDTEITMSETAYSQVPRTSSHIALMPGERLSMEDALYALALVSANDAATGIAETVSGSIEDFAELMNQEAAAMGATHSHFVNPNGMPAEDHYTTALDMARITAVAIRMPSFLEVFGSKAYDMKATNLSAARSLVSKNQFIDETWPVEGLLFSKTGWTSSALGTLVTAVKRDGVTLIAVTLKSPMLEDKYTDTLALLDYGFGAYTPVELREADMQDLMVRHGMDSQFELDGYSPIRLLVPAGTEKAKLDIVIPGGFDGSIGVTTFPITLGVSDAYGNWLPLADELVSIRRTEQQRERIAAQTYMTAAADIPEKSVSLWWLSVPALLVLCFVFLKKRSDIRETGSF